MSGPAARTVGVALLGYGTVGQGVAGLVGRHRDRWRERLGCEVVIRHVVVSDVSRPRDVPVPAGARLGDDAAAAVADPAVEVVIEVNGLVEENRALLGEALARGVHVVTANKALLAAHLEELTDAARRGGASLLYEASTVAGVPVVRTLRDLARVDDVTAVTGILNGSCNHILTAMGREGRAYEEVVAEAHELGYLEADPTADLAGHDARRKLRILATLALGGRVAEEDIPTHGIGQVSDRDLAALAALTPPREVRLLGHARALGDGVVEAWVEPVAVLADSLWAGATGPTNVVTLAAEAAGYLALAGPGAGRYETASGVVTDLLDVLRGVRAEPVLGAGALQVETGLAARWYVRCDEQDLAPALLPLLETALDVPGAEGRPALAGLTGPLPRHALARFASSPACAVIRWGAPGEAPAPATPEQEA